jgi:hypothetical protein
MHPYLSVFYIPGYIPPLLLLFFFRPNSFVFTRNNVLYWHTHTCTHTGWMDGRVMGGLFDGWNNVHGVWEEGESGNLAAVFWAKYMRGVSFLQLLVIS